ncbi:MAG TPA: hypothetical protein VH277_15160 [Gemmatimonadaceae bacterium]|jgi:hypothetical protein|nr:hypothetical protein [Gemmatimonadaceae bacterium]
MRESEKKVGRADHNLPGARSVAEGETQEPPQVMPDETAHDDHERGGSAAWGSEGSGEAPLDSRRKENS